LEIGTPNAARAVPAGKYTPITKYTFFVNYGGGLTKFLAAGHDDPTVWPSLEESS